MKCYIVTSPPSVNLWALICHTNFMLYFRTNFSVFYTDFLLLISIRIFCVFSLLIWTLFLLLCHTNFLLYFLLSFFAHFRPYFNTNFSPFATNRLPYILHCFAFVYMNFEMLYPWNNETDCITCIIRILMQNPSYNVYDCPLFHHFHQLVLSLFLNFSHIATNYCPMYFPMKIVLCNI